MSTGWQLATLEQVSTDPIVYGIVQPGEPVPAGVPFVQTRDIGSRLDITKLDRTDPKIAAAYGRSTLRPGDILVALRSDIGSAAVVPIELDGANISRGVARVRIGSANDSEFVRYALESPAARDSIRMLTSGSTLRELSIGALRQVQISVPPLAEQRKIAEILRTWDDAIDAELRLLKALNHRKTLIREKLFRLSRERGARMVFDDILTESRNPGTTGDTAQKITVKLYGKGAVPKLGRSGSASTRYYRRSAGQLIYSKLDFLNGAFAVIPQGLDGYESTLDLPAFDIDASVNPTWLIEYLTRPSYYTNQAHLARGQRKARRISPTEFLAESVGVPSRELQDTTAIILNEASAEVGKQQELLAQLQIQKRGLMQKLLTGEIRVTDDVAESLGKASIV